MEITVNEKVKRDLEDIAKTILAENVNEKLSDFFIVVASKVIGRIPTKLEFWKSLKTGSPCVISASKSYFWARSNRGFFFSLGISLWRRLVRWRGLVRL